MPENATTSDKPLHFLFLTDGGVTFKDGRRAVSPTVDGVVKSFLDEVTGQGSTVEDDVVKAKEKMHIAASPNETEKNVTRCFVQELCAIVIGWLWNFQRTERMTQWVNHSLSYSSGVAIVVYFLLAWVPTGLLHGKKKIFANVVKQCSSDGYTV
ncbi:hypothetical protein Tco_1028244 [Tanacetum coccineum]|uniref:Uncharacterized protein n=1 Tax=Tanacetum coccineum TaxID=301880 RepID=A0ABQ5G1B7_9ASTR